MGSGQWFPAQWPDRIRAYTRGELTVAEPRRAATVLLLRDGVRGTEVHMLRRQTSMAFAGGAYAYPGGATDPRDVGEVAWAGPSPAQWAARLGADEQTARLVVCAAVRETFEESGVLLAGPTADTVVADTTGPDWERERQALVARELSLAELLARRGLLLRGDLLAGWARWITPEFEERRFDTWFFVAALPAGQWARNASTEADRTVWVRPGDALAGYHRGELLMMPPTVATLRALARHPRRADAMAAAVAQDLAPVLAGTRFEGERIVVSWPGHDEFEKRIAREDGT